MVMMMIACITIKSGSVPFFEGLCAQIYDFRFEIIGGFAFTSFAFLFRKKKYVTENSSQSKISSCLLAYTYTCVLCTHIRKCIYRDLVHLDSSGPPGVSSRLLGSHEYPICALCVCACVYTHIHPHTLPPIKKREDKDNTFIFPSVKNNSPRQATSALVDQLKPPILVAPTLNEQTAHA